MAGRRRLIVAGCLASALAMLVPGTVLDSLFGAAYEADDLVSQGSPSPQPGPDAGFFGPGLPPEIWSPDRQAGSDLAPYGRQDGQFLPSAPDLVPGLLGDPTDALSEPGPQISIAALFFRGGASPQAGPRSGPSAPRFGPGGPGSAGGAPGFGPGGSAPSGSGFRTGPGGGASLPLITPGPQPPTASTPEPSATLVFGAGFLAVGAALRRRGLR